MPLRTNRRLDLRKTARILVMSVFLLLLLPGRGAAGGGDSDVIEVNLNPSETMLHWTLKDVLHTVHGTFKLQRGFVRFDMNTGRADGLVEVDARSGQSGDSARDVHMHNLILQSGKYPIISFRPQRVFGKLNSSSTQVIAIDGVFRIHGEDHPLQMYVTVRPEGNTCTATTHFVVPYVAWGMKDPSNFLLHVSKEVDIDVETTTAPVRP